MKCKLSDICEYRKGKINVSVLNNNNYVSTDNMLADRKGIIEAVALPNLETTQIYKEGDVLISNIRPYFKKIYYAKKAGGCSNDVLVFQAKNADSKFLYYLLADDRFFDYATATSKGTKMPRGDKNAIMNYEINSFAVDSQQKIAKILSSLDDKIELNNRINKNLEEQAQALFKSWFVDFEPFGGVMPSDWGKGCLLDIAEYINGLAMQKFRPSEGEKGLPVLKIKELRQGICDDNSELCSPSINDEYIVHDGDVIFSWSGSLLVDLWCGGTCGLNQHLFKVTSNKYNKWFFYLWTKYYLDRFIAIAADKATTMGHIKREDLQKAEVIIPSISDMKKLDDVLNSIIELIIVKRIENRKLANIRDTLLPKLMSGEIDVDNIQGE